MSATSDNGSSSRFDTSTEAHEIVRIVTRVLKNETNRGLLYSINRARSRKRAVISSFGLRPTIGQTPSMICRDVISGRMDCSMR
jgi:hypothetical protein